MVGMGMVAETKMYYEGRSGIKSGRFASAMRWALRSILRWETLPPFRCFRPHLSRMVSDLGHVKRSEKSRSIKRERGCLWRAVGW